MTEAAPWVIEVQTDGMPESLKLRLDKPLVMGRIDIKTESKPDIDLGPFGAEQQGVSRRHISLHADPDALFVTDLSSHNGTFVNGTRLQPEQPHLLRSDDELRLGRLKLDVRVIVSPNQGSGLHKQEHLQLDDRVYPGNGEAILIVEDDVEVANILSLIMNRAGYKAVISHDVIGAIRLFNQKRPAAVILDLMLPDLNGLEFCRYVRRDVERNVTPVVVVSAVKSRANVAQAMEAGADVFLGKPVSAQELLASVTSVIHRRKSGIDPLMTRHLPGTAPLQAMSPDSRHDAAVLFVAGHADAPITLTIKEPVAMGRSLSTMSRAHIDLSRYNAVENGVSRIHAYLHRKNGLFFVEDADSVNGTFLNGQPLKPKELTPVDNADEIRLGQLRMYIYFLSDKDGKSSLSG